MHDILNDLQEQFPLLHPSAALQLQAKTHETSSGITCTPSATITATSVSFSSLRIQPNCANHKEQNKMSCVLL